MFVCSCAPQSVCTHIHPSCCVALKLTASTCVPVNEKRFGNGTCWHSKQFMIQRNGEQIRSSAMMAVLLQESTCAKRICGAGGCCRQCFGTLFDAGTCKDLYAEVMFPAARHLSRVCGRVTLIRVCTRERGGEGCPVGTCCKTRHFFLDQRALPRHVGENLTQARTNNDLPGPM